MMVLASHTGWPPSEMLDMPVQTLVDYIKLVPKRAK